MAIHSDHHGAASRRHEKRRHYYGQPAGLFINGFADTEEHPFDVPLAVIQGSTIDELNYLGKLLEMQGDGDRDKFTAAVTLGNTPGA